ncbi:hypothetical protein AB833_16110 [Chromatiales bacterium (ex Bugula neritina AB1)]|nr:hypothetical protein AB833_16110 [Chromatiales bacterium (ex Bugula neritina AB1)]
MVLYISHIELQLAKAGNEMPLQMDLSVKRSASTNPAPSTNVIKPLTTPNPALPAEIVESLDDLLKEMQEVPATKQTYRENCSSEYRIIIE